MVELINWHIMILDFGVVFCVPEMNKLHRDVLLRNRVELVNDIVKPEYVLDYLQQEDIFTAAMAERALSKPTRRDQVRAILDDLPRRGPNAYDSFIRALQNTKQTHLSDSLKSFETELMAGEKSRKLMEGAPPPISRRDPMCGGYGAANATLNYSGSNLKFPTQASEGGPESAQAPPTTIPYASEPTYFTGNMNQRDQESYDIATSTYNVTPVQSTAHRARDPQKCYRIKEPPGRLIIVTNKTFENSRELPTREGVESDTEMLKRTFLGLGFRREDIVIFSNLTSIQLQREVADFVNDPRTRHASSVVCMLSTHGEAGMFYGSDGSLLPEDDIIRLFDRDRAQHLIGKPKMFIFQACRGDSRDMVRHDGRNVSDAAVRTEAHSAGGSTESDTARVHRLSDMFFARATVLGEVAMRNTISGSWFIQSFCEVLRENAYDHHLAEILTLVIQEVTKKGSNQVQLPSPTSHLSKFWYLPAVQ